MTPNQYRCETCKKTNEYMPFGHDCPFNGYDYTSSQIALITSRCGCASHSDFQSERESVGRISKAAVAGAPPLAIHNKLIRQNERDKVLDEVDEIISPVLEYVLEYFDSQSQIGFNVILIKHKLKKLRQAGE